MPMLSKTLRMVVRMVGDAESVDVREKRKIGVKNFFGISRMRAAFGIVVCGLPLAGVAHHSARITYDMDQVIEFEGEVTGVVWRNPHVRFTLTTLDASGGEVSWAVESIPVTRLSRVGVTPDVFEVGQIVRVAGHPARRSVNDLYAINLLLQDGREVLLDTPVARWTDNTIGTGMDETPGTASADASLGIFRVWSTDGSFLATETRFLTEGGTISYPLTEEARAAQADWDPLSPDNPFLTCTPKGMPIIMQQPNPIEFVDNGDEILLKIEEFDTVRVISLEPSTAAQSPAPLGHSVGRWEGNTLAVKTDGINWPYFDQNGYRQSDAIETLERFALDEVGSRLDYELTIVDPGLFTEPVTLRKSWRWVPGDQVLPFNCAAN
jgi:hypothetical protein